VETQCFLQILRNMFQSSEPSAAQHLRYFSAKKNPKVFPTIFRVCGDFTGKKNHASCKPNCF
jgi:hypothetical protein